MSNTEINTIRRQFQSGHWTQFLQMVSIDNLRGWTGQSVDFNFPVVAVVGENGSGKSTLLKVAACLYEQRNASARFRLSTFFVETVWDSIQNVRIDFRIKQGDNSSNYRITKPTKRWRNPESLPKRDVFLLEVSRTLPLDATVGYAKIARLAASEVESDDISDGYRERLSYILSRDYTKARFATSDVDENRPVGLLERDSIEISQFHQGAGEDSTLDLFRVLQGIPNQSLLIIDEIEASLHPRAQRRLVRFLLWLARQKRIQVILSTHSPYVLQELPQEARILLLPGPQGLSIVYGISPEFAMSRIDDETHPDLHIFVEDRDAEILLREILASSDETADIIQRISITSVGPNNVVAMLGQLSVGNKLPYRSLAVVDGDLPDANCLSLPGSLPPERLVYNDLKTINWADLSQRFGTGAGTLYTILDDAMRDPDHHKWNEIVGDKIRKSSISVWEVMANEWCKTCLQDSDRRRISERILLALP